MLRSALEALGLRFSVAEGEGAFYGPKIDLLLPDVDRRLWQTGTLQVFFDKEALERKKSAGIV